MAPLLFSQSAGSLGAVAGFAIAVVFAWRFMRPSQQARPRRPAPKQPPPTTPAAAGAPPESVASDAPGLVDDSGKVGSATQYGDPVVLLNA